MVSTSFLLPLASTIVSLSLLSQAVPSPGGCLNDARCKRDDLDPNTLAKVSSPEENKIYKTCGGLFNIDVTDIEPSVSVATASLTTGDKVPMTVPFPGDMFIPDDKRGFSAQVGIPNSNGLGDKPLNMTGSWFFALNFVMYDCETKTSKLQTGPRIPINITDEGYDNSKCP